MHGIQRVNAGPEAGSHVSLVGLDRSNVSPKAAQAGSAEDVTAKAALIASSRHHLATQVFNIVLVRYS